MDVLRLDARGDVDFRRSLGHHDPIHLHQPRGKRGLGAGAAVEQAALDQQAVEPHAPAGVLLAVRGRMGMGFQHFLPQGSLPDVAGGRGP